MLIKTATIRSAIRWRQSREIVAARILLIMARAYHVDVRARYLPSNACGSFDSCGCSRAASEKPEPTPGKLSFRTHRAIHHPVHASHRDAPCSTTTTPPTPSTARRRRLAGLAAGKSGSRDGISAVIRVRRPIDYSVWLVPVLAARSNDSVSPCGRAASLVDSSACSSFVI